MHNCKNLLQMCKILELYKKQPPGNGYQANQEY